MSDGLVIRSLSICSGIGGLDLGIKLADPRIQTVCYVERQAYQAAVIVARMEEAILDRAPVWDDLSTFPGESFSEVVDLVVGGIPCQPWSTAGRQRGIADERDLWPITRDLLVETRARALFLENVAGFKSNPHGLARIVQDVDRMGWDAQWGLFSCGGLGAKHVRKRLFFLAYAKDFHDEWCREAWGGRGRYSDGGDEMGNADRFRRRSDDSTGNDRDRHDSRREKSDGGSKKSSRQMGEADSHTTQRRNDRESPRRSDRPGVSVDKMANPHRTNLRDQQRRGGRTDREGTSFPVRPGLELADSDRPLHGASRGRSESEQPLPQHANRSSLWAFGPGEQWGGVHERLWPSTPKPGVRGLADGDAGWLLSANAYRADRLYSLGNAVSPPVAGVAWRVLNARAIAMR